MDMDTGDDVTTVLDGNATDVEGTNSTINPHFYGISLDDEYIYITDWDRKWVYIFIALLKCYGPIWRCMPEDKNLIYKTEAELGFCEWKLFSEGIKRHIGHNTFIIWLLIVYLMILGV